MTDLDALNRDFGIAGEVRFTWNADLGGPVVDVANSAATARIALKGAQVLGWTPAGEGPLLWVSPMARLDAAKAVRGGVPICWPWFADHPSDPQQPFHGLVRTLDWVPVTVTGGGGTTRLVFTLPDATNPALPLRPHLEVEVGRTLKISLSTHNGGAETVTLTEALHTYFAVADVRQVAIAGLDGVTYLDKVAAFARRSQSGAVAFAGEVDRIYLSGGPVRIADPGLGRVIDVQSHGSGATVVWNPGAERAARMPDVPGDSWRGYVCVETANAADAAVRIAPGDRHTMVAEITVRRG
ncbi:MAG: D-hexose-6-phosphate mutarotase [Hyphomicrobiaceae bacterium]